MVIASMMDFSIVIPTYRRPDELAGCLDRLAPGVQDLSFERYEVLVTDDEGSGSQTERRVTEEYPWARWIPGPGRNAAANRNHGAKQARAEWLVFTDDDCRPSKQWLDAYLAARIEQSPQVMEGKTVAEKDRPGAGWTAPINRTGGKLWSCNFAIHRTLYDQIGGFDEGYMTAGVEDIDFRVRIHAEIETVPFVPKARVLHPWRRSDAFVAQIRKGKSWNRFFKKFPVRADQYSVGYHIGALGSFLKWMPLALIKDEWRREAATKMKRLMKCGVILYHQFKNRHQQ